MSGKSSESPSEERTRDGQLQKDELDTMLMFDTIKFIEEVEKRPAIYDHSKLEYADRIARTRAWNELCEVIVPNWSSLSKEAKNTEAKALKSKWRNMRDYFMKEFRYETSRTGDKIKMKRKRCVYYDHLLFLVPNAKTREEERNEHEMSSAQQDILDEDFTGDSNTAGTFEFVTTSDYQNSIGEASMASSNDEFNIVKVTSLRKPQTDDEDYDRMFLLSLLPMMRKLPEDKKLDVRIQMQQSIALALRDERTKNDS